jgi:hypothetical protein
MQAWQIIVASAVAASIAAAALFLAGAVWSPGGAVSLVQIHWPAIMIVWIGIYSVAALVLSTVTTVRELDNAASGQAGPDWPRRYLLRLGITQYFSAVLVLLALGLLPLTIATEPFFLVSAASGSSLTWSACAVAILVGVLGWLIATVVATFRASPVWTAPPAGLDTQLLYEIVELLRAPRPVEPVSAAPELAEQLRQRDRSTLEAIKELAGAVNRLRNGVSEIQNSLQQRGPEQTDWQSSSPALVDVAGMAGELRATTSALTAAVAKFEDIAAGLAPLSLPGVTLPPRGGPPPGSRSQLSTELQELLRDMATGPAPRQEGSR